MVAGIGSLPAGRLNPTKSGVIVAEEDTKTGPDIEAAIQKYEQALSSHKQMTESDLGKLRQEVLDTIAGADRSSKQEIEILKEQLKDITDWRAEVQKAREERDKVRSSSSTMVVPPDDVKVTAPEGGPPPDNTVTDQQGKSSWWKKVW